MSRKPRRLTRQQADALIGDMTPAQKRATLAEILGALRMQGIDACEVFDATGRSYVKIDLDQVRAKLGDAAAAAFEAAAAISPEMRGHEPPAA